MKYNIQLFETLDSTNKYLENIDISGIDEGYIVQTNRQTGGVGQQENRWESEPNKNLTLSLLLKPTFLPIADRYMITKAISIAITEFLKQEIPDKTISIKWPNDIYVDKNKICGILISNKFRGSTFKSAIIGIGFNVNQTTFSHNIPNPISLKIITGKDYKLNEVMDKICLHIAAWYYTLQQGDYNKLDRYYLENLLYLGEKREYIYKGKGIHATIIDVSKNGLLRIKNSDNKIIECDLKELMFIHDK